MGVFFFSFWWSLEDWCYTFITLPGPGEFSLFFPSVAYWCINGSCHNAWCSTPSYSNQSIHYVKLYFRSSLYCYEDFCDVWKQKILRKTEWEGKRNFLFAVEISVLKSLTTFSKRFRERTVSKAPRLVLCRSLLSQGSNKRLSPIQNDSSHSA